MSCRLFIKLYYQALNKMSISLIMIALKDVLKDIPGTIEFLKARVVDIPGTLGMISTYFQNNPLLGIIIAFAIINRLRLYFSGKTTTKGKDVPIKETKVIEIVSKADFDLKVAETKKAGVIVIIDFYATW